MKPSAVLWLRVIGYSALILASLALIFSLIVYNWQQARLKSGTPPRRLRWHLAAKNVLPKGVKITDADLKWRLNWLPESASFLAKPSEASDKFVAIPVNEGMHITQSALSKTAPADAPPGGGAIPVEVKTDHAVGLNPGQRLTFVHEKNIVPAPDNRKGSTERPSLLLLAVSPSPREANITTLIVEVPPEEMKSLALLGTGQWRPVPLAPIANAGAKEKKQQRR